MDLTTNLKTRSSCSYDIHLKNIKNQLPNEMNAIFSELNVLKCLRQTSICKQKGYSPAIIFTFLFSLVFKGKTLNQVLSGREADQYMKKDTVYRLMNDPHNNWRSFLLRFSASVIEKIHRLTDPSTHLRTLVLDDSTFYRNRSQKVPGLARLWDHALQKGYKGYRMLTLGFSDGYSLFLLILDCFQAKTKSIKNKRKVIKERVGQNASKKPNDLCLMYH